MKKGIVIAMFLSLIAGGVSLAQVVDDVYFDPEKDRVQAQKQRASKEKDTYYSDEQYKDTYSYGYDDEYEYYEDYDYYYTSRIRRFHRPHYGFGFFDPIYADAYHYDPYMNPGVTVLIYDDIYSYRDYVRWNSWNRFNSWNRWNSWGPAFNVGIGFGFNSWNRFNSWGWDPWMSSGFNRFGWNSWGFGGPYLFGNSFVCPPSWGNGYYYNTVVNINNENNNYFGPRTGGGATGPGPGARPGRSPGILDHSPETTTPRRISTTGERLPESDRARVPATTSNPREIAPPSERVSPQIQNRDADRFFDRYPARDTESGRTIGTERATPNTNTDRATPAKPIPNTSGARQLPPARTYDPNGNVYERPRSINPGTSNSNNERTSPNTYERPRSVNPPSNRTPPKTYTPPSRTYDRNSNSTYERPRSTPPSSSSNSSFDRPRSSSSSGSSINSSPSRSSSGPSSSSSSSSSTRSSSSSSSSGGRVKNN